MKKWKMQLGYKYYCMKWCGSKFYNYFFCDNQNWIQITNGILYFIIIGLNLLQSHYHLCHDPSIMLATKAKAWQSAGRKCNLGVTFTLVGKWGNESTHSQVDSYFGSWNPYGVLNFQRGISRVQTHWIKELLIPLESFWTLDILNGLSWPIWIL